MTSITRFAAKCARQKTRSCKKSPARPPASYHVLVAIPMAMKLDVRGLTVELPTEAGWIRPVNDVSFSLAEGETLGIVGESGSGKTMLSLALMGLDPPGARRSGEAWLETRDGSRVNLVTVARDDVLKM